MPTASSNGTSSACAGKSGAVIASAMMRPARPQSRPETWPEAWPVTRLTHDLCRAALLLAPDQRLACDGYRDGRGRLVTDRRQSDRADKLPDRLRRQAHLVHRRGEARALGRTADQAHIGEAIGGECRDDEIEI